MTSMVLRGGRVIDPGSGLDRVTDLLIDAGKVTAFGAGLTGDREIDVSGLIVGPGFVDLHSHVHGIAGQRLQALDGVTTALDLEIGLMPIGRAYAEAAAAGRPLNYGFSASWTAARGQVLTAEMPHASFVQHSSLLSQPRWQGSSTRQELDAWIALLRGELEAGALGIGIIIGYASKSDPAEYLAVARLAAEAGVPTFTHVRELIEADPTTPIDGTSELVIAAAETGARMHHCHVNSTSRRHLDRVLTTIAASVAEGSKVTLEAYPYGGGSTVVGAAFLAPERLSSWGIRPDNIVLLPSGERIANVARLCEIREQAPATFCILEFLDEAKPEDMGILKRALAFPDAMVASDAMPLELPGGGTDSREWPPPEGTMTHPRTAGTFARSLRLMVTESRQWDWLEAFRRCSYLPARLLDDVSPAIRAKGHLGIGADADIVVIDPVSLSDRATYLAPTVASIGVRHLLVHGEPVVSNGDVVAEAYPGRPIRGEPAGTR